MRDPALYQGTVHPVLHSEREAVAKESTSASPDNFVHRQDDSFFQQSAMRKGSSIALPYFLPAKDKGSYLVLLWVLMEKGSEGQKWS